MWPQHGFCSRRDKHHPRVWTHFWFHLSWDLPLQGTGDAVMGGDNITPILEALVFPLSISAPEAHLAIGNLLDLEEPWRRNVCQETCLFPPSITAPGAHLATPHPLGPPVQNLGGTMGEDNIIPTTEDPVFPLSISTAGALVAKPQVVQSEGTTSPL
ncbi:hypothetical protein HPG69_007691 [Diceros bicornis minor]|uniref:Uncharacterized protein n=1 Tax=Diceros bicornis minor TaxID=77932 RepID=A0A7J7EAK9_DICBM|nr:hypothetical protein HPG69_007691 [Diceros bicornis minor]